VEVAEIARKYGISRNTDFNGKSRYAGATVADLKRLCQWLESGGRLPALQQILGHASIATKLRYARLGDEAVKEQSPRAWQAQTVAATVERESGS
jgi:integrase